MPRSKWGLRGITKSIALEAVPHGINVNLVAPDMVDGKRFRTKVVSTLAAKLGISEEEAAAHHASFQANDDPTLKLALYTRS